MRPGPALGLVLALLVLVVSREAACGPRDGTTLVVPLRRTWSNTRREDFDSPDSTTRSVQSARSSTVKLHRPELESYLSATVSIGKPPQNFELIIDTGSSLAYVPCSWCKTCGAHMHPTRRYDPRKSETSRAVSCKSPKDCGCQSPLRCECLHRQCYYDVRYAEGSSSRGKIFSDTVGLAENATRGARGTFGCATRETGLIQGQKADGLLGMSRSALAMAGALGDEEFAVCPSKRGGVMAVGGNLTGLHGGGHCDVGTRVSQRRTKGRHVRKLQAVPLSGVRVGSGKAMAPGGSLTMVVDTGSTFTVMGPKVHASVLASLSSQLGSKAKKIGPDYCFPGRRPNDFPSVELVFPSGGHLVLPPHSYLWSKRQGMTCVLFAKGKRQKEVHLGSIMSEGILIEFAGEELAFTKCNCDAIMASAAAAGR